MFLLKKSLKDMSKIRKKRTYLHYFLCAPEAQDDE